MPDILIRESIESDCEPIFNLIKELAEFERAPEEVSVTLEHFKQSGFGPHPIWGAYVAELDNKIVGMALYYIRYSTWKGQRMYLEDIIVHQPYRKKGIGTMLFERLLLCAKEKKMSGIAFQVLDWNEDAIRFYKKFNATFDGEWLNGAINF